MKKLLAILACTAILFSSVAAVSFAESKSENVIKYESKELKNVSLRTKVLLRTKLKNINEDDYPMLAKLQEARSDNADIRKENRSLCKELLSLLKQAKESNINLDQSTIDKIEALKEETELKKEQLKEKIAEKKETYQRGNLRAKIKELRENESLKEELTEKALTEIANAKERITERNTILKELVEEVKSQIS